MKKIIVNTTDPYWQILPAIAIIVFFFWFLSLRGRFVTDTSLDKNANYHTNQPGRETGKAGQGNEE